MNLTAISHRYIHFMKFIWIFKQFFRFPKIKTNLRNFNQDQSHQTVQEFHEKKTSTKNRFEFYFLISMLLL